MKRRHKTISFILLGILVGGIVVSFYWQKELQRVKGELAITIDEEESLKQSSRQLKKILNQPKPTNTQISYEEYEAPSISNTYVLVCVEPQEEDKIPKWYMQFKKEITDGFIEYACLNNDLKQIAYITQKEFSKGGYGSPGSSVFKLFIYDINKKNSTLLRESTGNYLKESCGEIKAWKKNGSLYFSCGGGDGAAYIHERIYSISIKTKEIAIVKECNYENFKYLCTTFQKTEEYKN